MGSKFPRWQLTHAIRTAFSPHCSAILTGQIPSVEYSARLTAAQLGRRFYTRTKTPADRAWKSIHPTPRLFTRRYGNRDLAHGRTAMVSQEPQADSSNQLTAAIPGKN